MAGCSKNMLYSKRYISDQSTKYLHAESPEWLKDAYNEHRKKHSASSFSTMYSTSSSTSG